MKIQIIIISFLFTFLSCISLFAQTGESSFKKVTISANEKSVTEILPSFTLGKLMFKDQDDNQRLDGNEEGTIRFYIANPGLFEIEELTISIVDINQNAGLSYQNIQKVKSIKQGDSALIVIPLTANDKLKDGSARFSINVTENKSSVTGAAQIIIPTKESTGSPVFEWISPNAELERTDFPVFEIAAKLKSATRITDLKMYLNGMIPSDKNVFTILPTDNPQEYLVRRNLTLEEGYNEVRIGAQNSGGVSLSGIRTINYSVQKIDQTYREKRLALVMGNSNYSHSNPLTNPVNDALAFAEALKGLDFTVMTFIDADQKTMKRAMDEFGEKLPEFNVGLFYFAGHGLQVNGINYLIPIDASLRIQQDVDYDCIDVGRVLGKMEAAETATNIIILDACRDNPFERSWSGRSGGKSSGLAFMTAPSGSIIAYATSPGKTASDGTGKNGLYTEALLQFIHIPGLPIEEFFKNVRTMVEQRSNGAQTPWESTSLKGNFFFKVK